MPLSIKKMALFTLSDKSQLHYSASGTGVPIVFLHGGLGWDSSYLRQTFVPMFDDLSQDSWQLVFVDLRGNGRSSESDEITIDILTSDVEELRQQLGFEKIILFGHSFGGLIAQEFAIRHSDRLLGLILDSSFPVFDFLDEALSVLHARADERQLVSFGSLMGSGLDDDKYRDALLNVLPLYFHRYSTDDAQRFAGEMRFSSKAFSQSQQIVSSFNTTDRLPEVKVPTLVVGGASDIYPIQPTARRLHELIPASELAVFENSGHFPFLEEPERYREVLFRILKRLITRFIDRALDRFYYRANRSGTSFNVQLLEDIFDMFLNRTLTDPAKCGYSVIRFSEFDQPKHFGLTLRQPYRGKRSGG
jgi:proline iminopeptidase